MNIPPSRIRPSISSPPPRVLPAPGIVGAIGWLILWLLMLVCCVSPLYVVGYTEGWQPLALLTSSSLLVSALFLVVIFGPNLAQALAVRRFDTRHLVCLLLLFPPLLIVDVAINLGVRHLYEASGIDGEYLRTYRT